MKIIVKAMAAVAIGMLVAGMAGAEEVKVWELPDDAKIGERAGWKPADAGAACKSGAALQNGKLVVMVAAGGPGAVIHGAKPDAPASATIQLLSRGAAGRVDRVEIVKKERTEAVLRLTLGTAQAEMKLRSGQPFVEIVSVREAEAVEIGGKMRYAVLPDFFGSDVVFDPRRCKSDKLVTSAENFLLTMLDGGNGIVMCVWPGSLAAGKAPKDGQEAKAEGRDPEVDLFFSGQGQERAIEKSRIEFAGKPVFVALLAGKAIWFEREISAEPAQKPLALDWQRPFEAKWRVDFISREGARSRDLLTSVVTWNATYRSEAPDSGTPGTLSRGGKPVPVNWDLRPEIDGLPMACIQGLWPFFLNMAWINDCTEKDKGRMFLAIYADMQERKVCAATNANLKAQARKENKEFVPVYPSAHPFERVLIYPVDRRTETPTSEMTPTDVMRESLGQGPCDYILDLAGIKGMPAGGARETLATCGTWDLYIVPFSQIIKGSTAWISVGGTTKKIPGLKPGGKLAPEDEALLVEKIEDLTLFMTAVNQRLQQYRKFYTELKACCAEEVKSNPKLKPAADEIMREAGLLDQRLSENSLKALTKARDDWAENIRKEIEEVKAGNYANLGGVGQIRGVAEAQDVLLATSRRVVKNIKQAAASVDTSNVEVARFAARVGDMCHVVSRNRHGYEGQ